MKETAIQWLLEELNNGRHLNDELIEKAKEMEKQQIIDAVYYTCSSMTHYDLPCGEQYYKKEYGR